MVYSHTCVVLSTGRGCSTHTKCLVDDHYAQAYKGKGGKVVHNYEILVVQALPTNNSAVRFSILFMFAFLCCFVFLAAGRHGTGSAKPCLHLVGSFVQDVAQASKSGDVGCPC